ncbi:Hypothetical protein W5S_2811 [Pectobacterium parmentieri]|uniref:Uncharacterized protein n=1 Tax=Pectobacterium parmentieri TaxID=1905730 RepID=A0A0H3I5R7_PECPM|nr:Hypothetical protein W5S_2811 [Pectobacterium parmentieri]
MSHPNQASATAAASGARPTSETASDKHIIDNISPRAAIVALLIRLHFYIGILSVLLFSSQP